MSTVTEINTLCSEVVNEFYTNSDDMELREDSQHCVYVRGAMYKFTPSIINRIFQLSDVPYESNTPVVPNEDPFEDVISLLTDSHIRK